MKNLKWKYEAGSAIYANILYIENMVYAATETGNFIGIYDNPSTASVSTVFNSTISASGSPSPMNNGTNLPSDIYNKSSSTSTSANSTDRKAPVWGTFQGDFRRSGSQEVECPTKPLITSQVSTFSFCQGDSIKITTPTSTNKLSWYTKSGSIKNLNAGSVTINKAEVVYLVSTNLYGCSVASDTVQIKQIPIPSAPSLTRDTANFLLSGAKGTTWYKDGSLLNDTAQKYKPTAVGSYTAKITTNGCTSVMSAAYYYLVTDIINLSKDEFIKIAPNPFVNKLNFDFVVKGYQKLNLDVFSLVTGSKEASLLNVTAGTQIQLGHLATGTYIIRVTSSDNKIVQQFKVIKL